MYQELAVAQLRPSPLNPRKHFDQAKLEELAASFASLGVIEPLVVRTNGQAGTYEVIAGERRRRAALLGKLETVPAVVREMTDTQVLETMVVENNQRQDVTALEESDGFRALLATGYDLEQLASRLGRSKKYVYDRMKLADLVPVAKQLLLDGKMTAGHGILLARLKPEDQTRAIDPECGGAFVRDGGATAEEEEASDDAAVDLTPRGRAKQVNDVRAYAAYKPKSVRELNHWLADHVRFDVKQAAAAAPLDFGEVAQRVEAAAAKPGRGKKVIAITFDHFIQPDARSESERTYGPRSFKFADGKEHVDDYPRRRYVAPVCEHAVLGVVAAGEKYGQAFDVCVARDRCEVHWKQEIAERAKNQKLRDTGQAKKADRNEAASRDRYERQRKEQEVADRRRELVESRAIALAVDGVTEITPDVLRMVVAYLAAGDIDADGFTKRFGVKVQSWNATAAQFKGLSGKTLAQAVVYCLLSSSAGYGNGVDFTDALRAFKVDLKKVEADAVAEEKKAAPAKPSPAKPPAKKAAAKPVHTSAPAKSKVKARKKR